MCAALEGADTSKLSVPFSSSSSGGLDTGVNEGVVVVGGSEDIHATSALGTEGFEEVGNGVEGVADGCTEDEEVGSTELALMTDCGTVRVP